MNTELQASIQDILFIIKRSDLEQRLEAEYYKPSISLIEKHIRAKSSKNLGDYIKSIASGSTPSVQEEQAFYAKKEHGIPFLRVQNLQTNGTLNLEEVKYINANTHNTLLKRSQVKENDLLVKITGVGRMAIASVAPQGFVGNTNQHMVVIKTKDKVTSEYLANFLNLDIIERLASRRSTGGTRPALDYSALKSIPIIEGINFQVLKDAEISKQQKESSARSLLAGIDDYLMQQLGITLPEKKNTIRERVFTIHLSTLTGNRYDPGFVFSRDIKIEGGFFVNKKLKSIAILKKGQSITSDSIQPGSFPVIAGGQSSPYSHAEYNQQGNCITISASGAYAGYVWYHNYPIFASDCTVITSKNESEITTIWLSEVLKLKQQEIYKLQQGAGQPHVYISDLGELNIPVPPLEKQSEIVTHINSVRLQARQLQSEAAAMLDKAKQEIEKMILGK